MPSDDSFSSEILPQDDLGGDSFVSYPENSQNYADNKGQQTLFTVLLAVSLVFFAAASVFLYLDLASYK